MTTFVFGRFFTFPMGFMFRKEDFRLDYLDPTLMTLRDSGLVEFYFGKWRSPKNMKEPATYQDEAVAIQLLLLPLGTWSVGIALAITLLAWEAFKGQKKSPNNQTNIMENNNFQLNEGA